MNDSAIRILEEDEMQALCGEGAATAATYAALPLLCGPAGWGLIAYEFISGTTNKIVNNPNNS